MTNHFHNSAFDVESMRALAHETPFFVFSKKKILQNYDDFKEFFPGALIHFAMKSNSEPEMLEVLYKAGCGFEVSSAFELHMLQKIKVDPKKIIYGTSVKPASHIKEFFDYGVDRYAFDSLSELEKIAAMAPGSKVYVRIIANDAGSVFRFSEKFGTEPEEIVPLLLRAKELGLEPYGVSFHVGSQASNPKAWARTMERLHRPIEELKKAGVEIDVIDLGGGYPCKYASADNCPTLEEISFHIHQEYEKFPKKFQLILEPGRGISATAGVLVTTVIAKAERKGNTWFFLDAGPYNALFETMAYQGSTRYAVSSLRPPSDAGEALFALAGPTGDSADVITREALLPRDTEVGDKLLFHNTGAYSLVNASPFNGFPKPAVYFI